MNKVVLIGRLTRDPILNFTPGTGTAVTKFTLAVNRRFKKEGQPEADFIPVVVWSKQAESTANYTKKGSQVSVSGRIEIRSYDKDGERRYVTEIVADEVHFLGSSKGQETNNQSDNSIPDDYFGGGYVQDDSGEDIPF